MLTLWIPWVCDPKHGLSSELTAGSGISYRDLVTLEDVSLWVLLSTELELDDQDTDVAALVQLGWDQTDFVHRENLNLSLHVKINGMLTTKAQW